MALSLSYSAYATYEQCPKMYAYRYIEKLPSRQNAAMSYGSSIHNTLYKFLLPLLPRDNSQTSLFEEPHIIDLSLKRLFELLDENWSEFGYSDRKEMFQRKVEAMDLLGRWHHKYTGHFGTPIILETKFSLSVGDVVITGRFDRIDRLEDGSVHIIDYKTGRLRSQDSVDADSQLSIYALAATQSLHLRVGKLSLYFVTQDKEMSTIRSEKSLSEFTTKLAHTGSQIQQQHFVPTPSIETCSHCDFASICEEKITI